MYKLLLLFQMAIVLIAVVGVIIYRIAIAAVLSTTGEGVVKGRAGLIASATAACINLVIIFILNFVCIYDDYLVRNLKL